MKYFLILAAIAGYSFSSLATTESNALKLESGAKYVNPITPEACTKITIPQDMTLDMANQKISDIRRTFCGSASTAEYDPAECQKQLTYWGAVQRCLMMQKN